MENTNTKIIERKKVVTIEYTLKNETGDILDQNMSLTYLHGFKNLVPGLEEALEGKKVGDTLSVAVPPEKGYGNRDENMIFTLPKENFTNGTEENKADIKVGMEFETVVDDVSYILTVKEIKDNSVVVDANHPLAGKPLFFDIKVTDIREAYSDEMVQGFPLQKEDEEKETK